MNKMNNLNGRVDIKTQNTTKLFELYDKIPAHQCTTFRNPVEGIWNESALSKAFFSKENIMLLQNGIRAGVFNKSKGQYTIGQQDCDSLKIIMRSVYLQYASNQPTHIKNQIVELNNMVLTFCVQQVYSEAQSYMKYISDVSTLAVPIAHPVMANNTDRQLELKKWF
jgi:hypothetical protein